MLKLNASTLIGSALIAVSMNGAVLANEEAPKPTLAVVNAEIVNAPTTAGVPATTEAAEMDEDAPKVGVEKALDAPEEE